MRGNLTIRGTEYRPEGENLPIAIVCHGFMAFQSTVKKYAKVIASCGYLTYTFDFCGGSFLKKKSEFDARLWVLSSALGEGKKE